MNRGWRGWALYALAWVPVLIGCTNLLMQIRGSSLGIALEGSLMYVVSVAVLGAVVWPATVRVPWPEREYTVFIALQAAMASLFSLTWFAVIALHSAVRSAAASEVTSFGAQFLVGLWVYGVIAGVAYALRVTGRLREREASVAREEALRMHAELQLLRAQLNPPFLFDTLHTVSMMLRRDPVNARLAVERFSDLLRYALDPKRLAQEEVTLADELGFVRDYLALQRLRLGRRLNVVEQIDLESLDCVIPPLTLQPIVENAIKHAITPQSEGATITIGASIEDDQLIVVIADDGPGAVEEGVRSAQGLGLRVGRQRLETRYAKAAHFTVTTAPGAGFTVTLTLPAEFRIVSNSYPALTLG